MVLNEEERLESEVSVDGVQLQHVSEFKYLGSVLDGSGTNEAECRKKVVSRRMIIGAIRVLVKAKVLHESLLVPVLVYGSGTMIGKEKERSRIRAV